jgi:hypothetical protein
MYGTEVRKYDGKLKHVDEEKGAPSSVWIDS